MEPATPLGDMRNFIEKSTLRGLSGSTNWFLNDHITVGATFQWTSFYQKEDRETWMFDGGAVTATAWKEFYLIPIYANAKYHFTNELDSRLLPYAGLNLGVAYIEQLATVGTYEFENKVWKFALAPEVGTLIPMGIEKSWGLNLMLRYQMAFYNENDINLLNFLNYSVGVYWKVFKRGERY
jgi:outer membrane protein